MTPSLFDRYLKWFAPLLLVVSCHGVSDSADKSPLSEVKIADSLGTHTDQTPAMDSLKVEGPAFRTLASDGRAEGLEGDVGGEEDPGGSESDGAPFIPYRPPFGLTGTNEMPPPGMKPEQDFDDARFPRPDHIRGLYVNAWAAGSERRMTTMLEIAETTEVNALVIDIKDATGFISHATDVPLAKEIGADGEIRIRDLPGLLDRLEAAGVYPIARIVVVKDPLLAAARPETAVQDTAGGVWVDSKNIVWQNLFNEDLWSYNIALAREVAEMGFPEVQWDYIRFPDAPASDMARAVFTEGESERRVDAVRGFLRHAEQELADLPVRSTADVFGVTTSFRRDVGIGQVWESFIDVVDVALPMVYPSHYWEGSFGYTDPNAYPYEVVYAALRDALRRSGAVEGAGLTRPWLQDFSLGSPVYGPAEVRAQIQATYDVGLNEWILWNSSTRYSLAALEPLKGFENDPLVRVAGVLSPTSRRYEVMDSVADHDLTLFEMMRDLALDTSATSPMDEPLDTMAALRDSIEGT